MLEGFFGGANGWYDSILNAAGKAADAVSSATTELQIRRQQMQ
jgi:NADH dehydrogenase